MSKIAFIILIGLLSWHSMSAQDERPNILWIIAEDMSPDLGCYGYPGVKTPNLDALAAQGMRFERVYTTAPVCSPSRSAFMTGMYQTTIGAHNHRSHREDGYQLPEGVRVITDWLRPAGYFTANIVTIDNENESDYYKGTGKTDWNFHYAGKPFDTDQWSDLKDHQPFYAQINFPETHRGHAWDHAHEHIEQPANPSQVTLPPYYPDHPEARAVWAQYLNTIMSLDKKVGYVLDKLEKDGLDKNTIVFFFADHGRAMVRSKQWPYESGLKIPLIIRWPADLAPPSNYRSGVANEQLIASIDIAATTLSLAGIQPPILMQGRVFLGDHCDPERSYVFGGRDRGDETVDRIRTIRDHRYRYIRNYYPDQPFLQLNRYKELNYPMIPLMRELAKEGELNDTQLRLLADTRPKEELYDLENDPFEINNLAGEEKYRHRLRELSACLDVWMMETNDQGRFPEDPSIVKYWDQRQSENYDERIDQMHKERARRKEN